MHAFLGDHLLVYDPFGLTRITLPAKVKTNRKVVGDLLVANGPLLVGHSEVNNRRFAMSVPELKVIPTGDSWSYDLSYGTSIAVTPAGLPVVVGERLEIYGTDGKQKAAIAVPAGKPLGRIDLGPELVASQTFTTVVAIGPDGTFVALADGRAFGGTLAKTTITNPWTAVAGRTQGQVHLRAGAFGAFLSAFHPARNRAMCVLVAGGKLTHDVVECIAPVDFDGTRIAYQPSPTAVCRKPIGGDAIEHFELPASAIGRGRVMADGDRLLFLTPDHERVIDVVADDVVVRGLPDEERPVRSKVLAFVDSFRAVASVANLDIRLAALLPPAYGMGHRPQWQWTDGDESLLHKVAIGNFQQRTRNDPDFRAGSYSSPTTIARVTEAEVQRVFDVIDAHALDLLPGLAMASYALDWHWNHRRGTTPKPVFDKPAARMLLWALVETVGKERPPKLAPNGKAWAQQPLDAKTLIAKLDPSNPWRVQQDGEDCQTTAAWLVLDYFEADAVDVFADWLIDRPSGMAEANTHIVGTPVARMMAIYPDAAKRMTARLEQAAASSDEKRRARATALQSTVSFEMR